MSCGDRVPPNQPIAKKAIGERAFEAVLDRLLGEIVVADNQPRTRDLTEALARVEHAAAGADYLGAIRLLGEVEVTLGPARPHGTGETVHPEDVEQALGDLRRAIPRWGSAGGREAAEALCREARRAAGEGRWQAAWALIEEADERLAQGAAVP